MIWGQWERQKRKKQCSAGEILPLDRLGFGMDLDEGIRHAPASAVWKQLHIYVGLRTRAERMLIAGKRRQQLKVDDDSRRDARAADSATSPAVASTRC